MYSSMASREAVGAAPPPHTPRAARMYGLKMVDEGGAGKSLCVADFRAERPMAGKSLQPPMSACNAPIDCVEISNISHVRSKILASRSLPRDLRSNGPFIWAHHSAELFVTGHARDTPLKRIQARWGKGRYAAKTFGFIVGLSTRLSCFLDQVHFH